MILKDSEIQFYTVLHYLLLTLLSVSYLLKKYVFSLIMKREFFLLQIHLYQQYPPSHSLIIRISFTQGLPCSFCKQKGHWKAQCPKLRHQNQAWKSGSQSLSNAHRPPQIYRPPQHNTAAVVSSDPITDLSTLAKQFQKFFSLQP